MLEKRRDCSKKAWFHWFEIETVNESNRSVSISGDHKTEYIVVEIACDQKLGVTALSIAGLDNEYTYDLYLKLFNSSDW